jgi:glycosyltransferase involved in cell wall biosynthesis
MSNASANPVLSVVVLCFNQEPFLARCLDSILDQSLNVPFEIVISDDASSDRSPLVAQMYAKRYPARIRLICHESNVGISRNYADAMDSARGKYIAYIDGDDYMLPGKLQRQLDCLNEKPNVGLVAHAMRTVDAVSGHEVAFHLPRHKPSTFDAAYLVTHGPFFFHSSVMFRTDLRRRHQVDMSLKWVTDVANLIQILADSSGCYLDDVLGVYRVNPNGITSTVITNPAKNAAGLQDSLHTIDIAEGLGVPKGKGNLGRARLLFHSAVLSLNAGFDGAFRDYIESSVHYANLGAKQRFLYVLRRFPRSARTLYDAAKRATRRK